MLTQDQQNTFLKEGLIRLPGLLPVEYVSASADRLFAICKKSKSFNNGQWVLDDLKAARQLRKQLANSKAFGSLMTPILDGAIRDLVSGRQLQQRTTRPNLLFTLPQNYGHENKLDWHIDVKRLSGMKLAGVQLFAFLESVRPGGGGPVAVTGSHRIETRENVPREIIRSQLRDHAFFADVLDHTPEERADLVGKRSKLDGVELAVVELTGEPGDVYLMDLWVLHTRWPNYSDSSRMMLTQRFLLKEAYERVGTLIG
ncbi:phytanoyl-CoA dioxygenase family protein [Pseudomonadales bacterium]|nr:phytanoyl-CoA dioxygenase family protein [Pseudomonadales bacterium]